MEYANSVEEYYEREDVFHNELLALREIFLSTEMEEAFKWKIPAYCLNGKNIAGVASFKNYTVIWFHQGIFLKDDHLKFTKIKDAETTGMRQWRFSSLEEIENDKHLILAYLEEAIENQKLGKELKPKPSTKKNLLIPDELKKWLAADTELKTAFGKLTPSKQRDYADYIAQAKRAETKTSRLEKITSKILSGTGLHDKYK